jgi:hypothetical protein
MRQFVSVGPLGYLTATLLTIVCALGAVVVVQVMPVATSLLRHADLPTAWAQLDGNQQRLLGSMSIAFIVAALLAMISFSVFVGLTTHNATGLGAGQPTLTPYRAGTCWAGALWTQVRITNGLAVPAALLWSGHTVPGLLALLVVLEIVHRNVDDLFGWLVEPGRSLPELYIKLGAEGSARSRLASIWAVLFRLANILAIAVSALPMTALAVVAAWVAAGFDGSTGWQSTGLGPAQIAVAVLAGSFTCCTAGAVALLVPVTLGLVRRQRDRRTLVRVGRARNWAARPGEGSSAQASRYQPTSYSGYDEDRIVERLSPFMTPAESGPEDGAPAFGEPSQDGPGQEEPD